MNTAAALIEHRATVRAIAQACAILLREFDNPTMAGHIWKTATGLKVVPRWVEHYDAAIIRRYMREFPNDWR